MTIIGALIDIESSAGAKYGPGPIRSATNWTITRRLDLAGEFSFTMPCADSRAALLAAHRIARAYALVNGARSDRGSGVIDNIELSVDGSTVTVSGSDMARELTYRLVGSLLLSTDAYYTAVGVHSLMGPRGSETDVDMPDSYDGNLATSDNVELKYADAFSPGYLYILSRSTFTRVYMHLGPSLNNEVCTLALQYYDGDLGWADVAIVDGTAVAGAPLAQDGEITWARSAGEVMVTHAGITGFWRRFRVSPQHDLDPVDIKEVETYSRTATTADLSGIIAFAPAGWTLDAAGYASTTTGTYAQFDYDTVLAAFCEVARRSGEHFRVHPTDRKITWLRGVPEYEIVHSATAGAFELGEQLTDGTSDALGIVQYVDAGANTIRVRRTTAERFAVGDAITGGTSGKVAVIVTVTNRSSSGVRAVRGTGDPVGLEANTDVCIITRLTRITDASDYLYTRVYPFGSGNGETSTITLEHTTRTATAPYSLDIPNNCISRTVEGSPRIEKRLDLNGISSQDNPLGDEAASDALFDAAMAWFRQHEREYNSYELQVTKLDKPVLVGQTIRVIYHEYVDAYHSINIDDDLIVLETTEEIDNAGQSRVVAMKVATLDRWPETDAETLRRVISDMRRYQRHAQPHTYASGAGVITPIA